MRLDFRDVLILVIRPLPDHQVLCERIPQGRWVELPSMDQSAGELGLHEGMGPRVLPRRLNALTQKDRNSRLVYSIVAAIGAVVEATIGKLTRGPNQAFLRFD